LATIDLAGWPVGRKTTRVPLAQVATAPASASAAMTGAETPKDASSSMVAAVAMDLLEENILKLLEGVE
jgi:hypothetical protein